jgi:phosphoglycerol transferase MdoB-like AlkP superfamily enzyme
LFWVLFFMGAKGIFLVYHSSRTKNLSPAEVAKVFLYGLRLDVSFAAYLSVLPFLLFFIRSLVPRLEGSKWLSVYTCSLILLQALFTMVDLELYGAWGFRLDSTPLQYLSTPREMLASVSSAPLLLLAVLLLALGLGSCLVFFRFFRRLPAITYRDLLYSCWCLFLIAFLILPIRGGWQQIPLNQSDVYFSDKAFANHAAVNVTWNLMYSISKKNYDQQNPYAYLPDSVAQSLVQQLYSNKHNPGAPSVLRDPRPNVLFIILESYTGKLVGSLGGEAGVSPNLDKIARQGILFDSIYASGDRSEKGLVALLSAYPVQTTTSIIKTPRKTENLPHINKVLKNLGYATSFYYGGELAFANIKSYLLSAGYGRLLSKYDFDSDHYKIQNGACTTIFCWTGCCRICTRKNSLSSPPSLPSAAMSLMTFRSRKNSRGKMRRRSLKIPCIIPIMPWENFGKPLKRNPGGIIPWSSWPQIMATACRVMTPMMRPPNSGYR